jgi:anti-anti-sigma factor
MFRRRRRPTHAHGQSLFSTPESGLAIHCVDDGETHLVAPAGELDFGSAWTLDRALRRAESSDAREIVLDLGGLKAIDSTGVEIVVRAVARAREQDRRLLIRRGPAGVHRAFELSGAADRLPFAEYSSGIPLP